MTVRAYRESDLEKLLRWHEQSGLKYPFPEMNDWRTQPKLVVEQNGEPAMAGALRLTSEAYLWVNRETGTPAERWQQLLALHEAMRQEAARIGYDDVHAFLPPGLPGGFRRRLKRLGWTREPFEAWWRPTEAAN